MVFFEEKQGDVGKDVDLAHLLDSLLLLDSFYFHTILSLPAVGSSGWVWAQGRRKGTGGGDRSCERGAGFGHKKGERALEGR
uniref:Uncharacterized protein n=1 Tax=Arundo donax TaxID=35708 RepID=A0A0A9C6Y3_ARUDO